MWWLLFSSSLVFFSHSSVSTRPVINEVYYDHPGADAGWEFVELFCDGPGDVGLAGWSLENWNDRNGTWDVLWRGAAGDTIGAAGGLFVIGGDLVVPPPSVSVALTLRNTADAIRLVDNGTEVDRVGYGVLEDPRLFEGAGAPDAPAGSSLGRYPDGFDNGQNADDFRILAPSPGRLNRPRHNLALSPVSMMHAAVPSPGDDTIAVRVTNTGLDTVTAGGVTVTIVDSAVATAPLATLVNEPAIAPGAWWDAALGVTVAGAYSRLWVTVFYAPDERPGDNAIVFVRRLGDLDVVVSEVMSDPPAGCPEYIEIFNAGAAARSLAGYRLRDRVSAPAIMTQDPLLLEPGAYLALTADAEALGECFPAAPQASILQIAGAWPSLNHSGSVEADSVVVVDDYGIVVDRVAYPPQPSGARGRSLERVDLFAGERTHTWVLSQSPARGTPGAPNGRTIERPTTAAAVTVSPNPFDPARDESMLITVPQHDGAVRSRVQIFDVLGRRVVDLGSSYRLPFVYLWDGRDGHGRDIVPGFYVVACEFFSLDSGVRSVERVVVGCARKKE